MFDGDSDIGDIIENLYGLKDPFVAKIPNSDLIFAKSQMYVLQKLLFVAKKKMFGVITGECGIGKTTVLRKLSDMLDENEFVFLYITDSKLTPRHFYNGLLFQLGQDGAFYRGDSRRKLHQEIENINEVRHRKLVITVDEAHLLNREMLEELRFLLNFKMDSESPLALILSGQPQLEDNLNKKTSAAIMQRVDFRCKLSHLNQKETCDYIAGHLKYAGAQSSIFSDSAIKEIFVFSHGTTRTINKVCYSCLLYGAIKGIKLIDDTIVKLIIESEFK